MPAEQMGQISRRLRFTFAVTSILFLFALAISPFKDSLLEWKRYKRAYVQFAQTRPDTKKLLADYRPEIDQIWLPDMGVVDRCTTCHQGITEPSLLDGPCPNLSARILRCLTEPGIGAARCAIGGKGWQQRWWKLMRQQRHGNNRSCPSISSRRPAELAIARTCRKHRSLTAAASLWRNSTASGATGCKMSRAQTCWGPI